MNTTYIAPPVLVTGFSGVGKSWMVNQLLAQRPAATPVEVTTRPHRAGVDESGYLHISEELFGKLDECGALSESKRYRDCAYGTVYTVSGPGKNRRTPLFLVDVDTAKLFFKEMPCHVVAVFVPKQILEPRLRARSDMTDEKLNRRLEEARHLIPALTEKLANFTIINLDGEEAVSELAGIVDRLAHGTACATRNRRREIEDVMSSFDPLPEEQPTTHTVAPDDLASIQDNLDELFDSVMQEEMSKRKNN